MIFRLDNNNNHNTELISIFSLIIAIGLISSHNLFLSFIHTSNTKVNSHSALAFKPTPPAASKQQLPSPTNQSKISVPNDYAFVRKWGYAGSANGGFSSPSGIAVDPLGNVYVADTGNNRIQIFDSNGNFTTTWGSNPAVNITFHAPQGVAVDPLGGIYVVDTGGGDVQKFTNNGTLSRILFTVSPKGIATDISALNIYVANGNNVIVTKYIPYGDPFFGKWGNYTDFKFTNGAGLTTDSSGNVYVADPGNNRIEKFTSNGTLITTWGKAGKGDSQFVSPLAIALDSSGNVFVADTGNNRIQEFGNNGTFITKIGSAGSANGHFLFPAGVAIDSKDNLYVTDRGNNRIQVFAPFTNSSR